MIAVDTTSNSGTTVLYGVTGTNHWHHTCTGSDLTLVVGVSVYASSVTGVTYNGVAMTQQQANNKDVGGYGHRSYLYTLANPATGGSYEVAVTYASPEIDTGYGGGMAISLSGTNTTTPIDVSGGATGTGTAVSKAVTTNYANSYVIDNAVRENSGTTTIVGAGQTEIYNQQTSNGSGQFGSYKQQATAGSVTMSWTLGASVGWATSVVAIREGVVIKKTIPTLLTMKVG